jgi:hypothetical protein
VEKRKRPVTQESNPPFRTIAGVIDEASRVRMGSGFEFERKGPGDYLIKFTPPFNGIPAVIAQVHEGFDPDNPPVFRRRSLSIMGAAPSLLRIYTTTERGALGDRGFSFIAVAD